MITKLLIRPYCLRLAFGLLLVFFTGCKIVSPVYVMMKAVYKEITATLETDDDQVEKTANNNWAAKPSNEYAGFINHHVSDKLWYTDVVHATAYTNHYRSAGYLKVAGPPPRL